MEAVVPKLVLVEGIVVLMLASWLPTAAAQAADEIRARGSWQVSKPSRDTASSVVQLVGTEERTWRARPKVSRSRELSGPVTIDLGAESINAELRGEMNGDRVWGDVLDSEGKQVATFSGVYGPGGWRGTFTSATDDQGTWEWDGTPESD
jgi:hypothetical protein